MTVSGKARKSAIRRYRILALIMGLLSGGLFACGIIAVSKYPEGGGGPPYYIGGFVVGILVRVFSASHYL